MIYIIIWRTRPGFLIFAYLGRRTKQILHHKRFWETAYLPLSQANIDTYFIFGAKCWIRGGVGGPKYLPHVRWSRFQNPGNFCLWNPGLGAFDSTKIPVWNFRNCTCLMERTFRLHRPDPSHRAFGYCSCKQDTTGWYWGKQFCQMERDISVRPAEMTRPVKDDLLQS